MISPSFFFCPFEHLQHVAMNTCLIYWGPVNSTTHSHAFQNAIRTDTCTKSLEMTHSIKMCGHTVHFTNNLYFLDLIFQFLRGIGNWLWPKYFPDMGSASQCILDFLFFSLTHNNNLHHFLIFYHNLRHFRRVSEHQMFEIEHALRSIFTLWLRKYVDSNQYNNRNVYHPLQWYAVRQIFLLQMFRNKQGTEYCIITMHIGNSSPHVFILVVTFIDIQFIPFMFLNYNSQSYPCMLVWLGLNSLTFWL